MEVAQNVLKHIMILVSLKSDENLKIGNILYLSTTKVRRYVAPLFWGGATNNNKKMTIKRMCQW